MSNDLNSCSFIGRLGRDVETRYAPSGDVVANFSMAVCWKSKGKDGTEWVRISAFGKLAELCAQYLSKGSQVYVSGRLTSREWTDKEGQKRYTTEIVADRVQFLGRPSEGKPEPKASDYQRAKDGAPQKPQTAFDDLEDDIPFN